MLFISPGSLQRQGKELWWRSLSRARLAWFGSASCLLGT